MFNLRKEAEFTLRNSEDKLHVNITCLKVEGTTIFFCLSRFLNCYISRGKQNNMAVYQIKIKNLLVKWRKEGRK